MGNDRLAYLLMTQPYVLTDDIRSWCNHRSRISDLRKERGWIIKSIKIEDKNGKLLHGYELIAKAPEKPVEKQMELAI
jgi:hypothetical protein